MCAGQADHTNCCTGHRQDARSPQDRLQTTTQLRPALQAPTVGTEIGTWDPRKLMGRNKSGGRSIDRAGRQRNNREGVRGVSLHFFLRNDPERETR
jgi:hypothetical protein